MTSRETDSPGWNSVTSRGVCNSQLPGCKLAEGDGEGEGVALADAEGLGLGEMEGVKEGNALGKEIVEGFTVGKAVIAPVASSFFS